MSQDKELHMWGDKRYHSLDYYLKNKYKQKVCRLSLNAGLSCPNRDGTIDTCGCIFCSAGGSGDFSASAQLTIPQQIASEKQRIRKKCDCNCYIAYFQAYTNTYAPLAFLRQIYMDAAADPEVVIISIATRPDCLSHDILHLLSEINQIKPVWIELGLQTIHDKTRGFLRSGFTYQTFLDAVTALNKIHIPIIVHLILGLPDETHAMMLDSVRAIAQLPVSGVKLQLLHILEHTDLAAYYEKHPFPVFTQEEYCDCIADCIELLPEDMVLHRITGDGPKDLLIAPRWSTNKKRVLNQIQRRLKERGTWQGRLFIPSIR